MRIDASTDGKLTIDANGQDGVVIIVMKDGTEDVWEEHKWTLIRNGVPIEKSSNWRWPKGST